MCIGTQSPESHNIMSDCQLQLHIYYINVVTNIIWMNSWDQGWSYHAVWRWKIISGQ